MVSIRREHRALAILRALQSEHGYRINDRVLMQYLDQLALGGTRSDIRASLAAADVGRARDVVRAWLAS